jgi:hypothetical protein
MILLPVPRGVYVRLAALAERLGARSNGPGDLALSVIESWLHLMESAPPQVLAELLAKARALTPPTN